MLNRLRLTNNTKAKAFNNILLALALQATVTLGSDKVFDRLHIVGDAGNSLIVIHGIAFGAVGDFLGDDGLEEVGDSSFLDDTSGAVLLSVDLFDLLVLALEDTGAAETDGASHDRVSFQGAGVCGVETESAGLRRVEDDGDVRRKTRTRTSNGKFGSGAEGQ
jgi:hypothetical protein